VQQRDGYCRPGPLPTSLFKSSGAVGAESVIRDQTRLHAQTALKGVAQITTGL
jgi:hypothetical protein